MTRGGAWRRLKVALFSPRRYWEHGLTHEAAWWETWIEQDGRRWSTVFRERLDPRTPLEEPLVVECLRRIPEATVRLLDVGAGPCTSLGATHPGKHLEIVAIDPLAEAYEAAWKRRGLVPPVPTEYGDAEHLVEQFGSGDFDIAHARNSLDHTADPIAAIQGMLAVVKEGRYVCLRHSANEARKADYRGLHQWNFSVRDGELLVRRLRRTRSVSEAVASVAAVDARSDGEWTTAVLTKHAR